MWRAILLRVAGGLIVVLAVAWWMPWGDGSVPCSASLSSKDPPAAIHSVRWVKYSPRGPVGALTLWRDGRSHIEVYWLADDRRLALAQPQAGWTYHNGLFTRDNPFSVEQTAHLLQQVEEIGAWNWPSDPQARLADGIYCLVIESSQPLRALNVPGDLDSPDPATGARYAALGRLLQFDTDAYRIDPGRCSARRLIAALDSPDERLRRSAAYLLAQFNDAEVVQRLRQALDDPDPAVHCLARQSLRQLSANAEQVLLPSPR